MKKRLSKEYLLPRLDILQPKDLAEIILIEKKSFTNPWKHEQSFLEPADQFKAFTMHLANQAIGYLIIDYDDNCVTIIKMAIRDIYRRSSFGTYMVQWAKQFGCELGLKRMCLRVRESNVGTIDFYKHVGFSIATKLEGYYKLTGNEDAYEMLLMLK